MASADSMEADSMEAAGTGKREGRGWLPRPKGLRYYL